MYYSDKLNELLELFQLPSFDENKLEKHKTLLEEIKRLESNHSYLVQFAHNEINFLRHQELFKLIGDLVYFENEIDHNELESLISACKEELQSEISGSEYYNSIKNEIDNLNNANVLFEFVQKCFENGFLTLHESMKLNIEIAKAKVEKDREHTNEVIAPDVDTTLNNNTIEVPINDPSDYERITEQLNEIFNEFGYSYSKLPDKLKDKLCKFSKIDTVRKGLIFIKNNNISEETFSKYKKVICDILIFYDETALNQIRHFIEENECTLTGLLKFSSIFFSRNTKFKFKNSRRDGSFIDQVSNNDKPVGEVESFMYVISLIKKTNIARQVDGWTEDRKFKDEDFQKGKRNDGKGYNTLLTYPTERIQKNISILKRYGIIDDDILPEAVLGVLGTHEEYVLDRFIEAGLYDYIKNNSSKLHIMLDLPIRWYKIKRANAIYDRINKNKGIRAELINEQPLYGIRQINTTEGTVIIEQDIMPHEELEAGRRFLPDYRIKDAYGALLPQSEIDRLTFERYYKYIIPDPKFIYNYNRFSEFSSISAIPIEATFSNDYKDNSESYVEYENDEFIKFLDSLQTIGEDGVTTYPVKQNNVLYYFYFPDNYESPRTIIRISRQKVLRLCKLLKEQNLWLNSNMLDTEQINLMLSILLKDSVVSLDEVSRLRKYLVKEKQKARGRQL